MEKIERTEGLKVLALLRVLDTEDQKIAFAILEGMRIQRTIAAAATPVDGPKPSQGKEALA